MEETISGYKKTGNWFSIVEFGEQVTDAVKASIETCAVEFNAADQFNQWNEWRPKHHEYLEQEVSEKTANQASTKEGKGEREGKPANEDIQKAGEKLEEGYAELENEDTNSAVERWKQGVKCLGVKPRGFG